MVESTALEMRHTRKGIGGSNPPLSAIISLTQSSLRSLAPRGRRNAPAPTWALGLEFELCPELSANISLTQSSLRSLAPSDCLRFQAFSHDKKLPLLLTKKIARIFTAPVTVAPFWVRRPSCGSENMLEHVQLRWNHSNVAHFIKDQGIWRRAYLAVRTRRSPRRFDEMRPSRKGLAAAGARIRPRTCPMHRHRAAFASCRITHAAIQTELSPFQLNML